MLHRRAKMSKIKRALISVSDKTGIVELAQSLEAMGVEILSTGGSATIFEIEPRIIVEPRSNSLLIAGDEEMVARIEEWIDVLDVEVEPRGNTHVYRLKNTDATEVADVLTRVLEQERLGAQQARAAGQSGSTGTGLEIQASAVGRDVIDDHYRSLTVLANTLGQYGVALEAGQRVITGSS